MTTEQELARAKPAKDTLLTIGVFDGVHLGHKYLLGELKKEAKKQGWLSGVVTFRQHPQAVLSPETRLPFLTDLAERERLLKEAGIDIVVVLSFTRELSRLSAAGFLGWLKEHLRMRGLVIGYDFALGLKREGNTETLRTLGEEMGFSVGVIPAVTAGDEVVSSTAVREALARGDMARVNKLLGRDFRLHGRVVTGDSRGRGLGFPTANLAVDPGQALPPDGVYVTRAHIGKDSYPAMTNIGRRPTFTGAERAIEVYLLDFEGDVYDREMSVDLVHYLRGEKQFTTAEELKQQIAADVARGRELLKSNGRKD
jgi:riboflavin kinase/FMN adenylyltransferase